MVSISYTRIPPLRDLQKWTHYLPFLSADQQQVITRFVHWEDQFRSLYGKILLKRMLQAYGYCGSLIKALKTNEFGRPFLDIELDFNISHSGDIVICALSRSKRVGIDIEEIKPIDYKEFKHIMTPNEWNHINLISDPIPEFYRIWAQKESVIKADGRGLIWPLHKIEANNIKIVDQHNAWYPHPLQIDPAYACCLATDQVDKELAIVEVKL